MYLARTLLLITECSCLLSHLLYLRFALLDHWALSAGLATLFFITLFLALLNLQNTFLSDSSV